MIARGERPLYRLRVHDGSRTVDAMAWISIARRRDGALAATRVRIAEWLDVPPEAFDAGVKAVR